MPSVTYAENKINIYKYVENNREKYNKYQVKYKTLHKEKFNDLRMDYYYYKKSCDYDEECKRFRRMCM